MDSRLAQSPIARLAGLLADLDVGLAAVDPARDFAHVNSAAADLLRVSAGDTTASHFAAIMRGLARRAHNQLEVVSVLETVKRDPAATFKSTWVFDDSPTHLGVVSKPAPYPGFDGRIWAFYDNSPIAQLVEKATQATARIRASSEALLDPLVLLEGVWRDGHVVDLIYRDVNDAACDYLGLTRDELLGHSVLDSLPNIDGSGLLAHYVRCAQSGEPVILDAFPYHNELLDDVRYYDVRAAQAWPGWMSLTWRDVTERFHLTQRVAASEEQFRLLAENVADVVVRLDDEGMITWTSNTIEGVLGAPAEHWIGRNGLGLVVPEDRPEVRAHWTGLAQERHYIGRGRVIGADGIQRWVHLHSKPFYTADGNRDGSVASFRVIDNEVAAESRAAAQIEQRDEQNRSLAQRLEAQTDRLLSELSSAARYVMSILPSELPGEVHVTSRYVPSTTLGGDSYDFRWIDEDHLIFYVIDVSGHGVESALVSVSVHNLLRSGSIPAATLVNPSDVLTELNRLFEMDQQGGNYFTAWYGVYQPSTRTVRYACAGHPPALAITEGASAVTQLSGNGIPLGMFGGAPFTTRTYRVPANAEILLYSDGAYELDLPDGRPWSLKQFIDTVTEVTAGPDWSLDELLTRIQAETESGSFDDDCTLVRLRIS